MNPEDLPGKSFLDELYLQTKGDPAARVSMYDVGAAVGMSRDESGSLAESLIVEGLVELKTLAGGIGITNDGLAILGVFGPIHNAVDQVLQLSSGPVANDDDILTITQVVRQIKDALSGHQIAYDCLEQIVIDLKTIELHLLSPRPKTAVFKAIIHSLHDALVTAGVKETATMLITLFA
jgi:hypothetical protein